MSQTMQSVRRCALTRTISAALAASALGMASHANAATFTVTTSADTVAADGQCSLREAIQNANNHALTNADCLVFGDGSDTIKFASGVASITLSGGELDLKESTITIDGGSSDVTIDANKSSRIFNVYAGRHKAILSHLIMQNAVAPLSGKGNGGAIVNSGTLTLNNCTIRNAASPDYTAQGVGIYNNNGALYLNSSTITGGQSAAKGGGIASFGAGAYVVLNNSTISGNTAAEGAGIYVQHGQVTFNNSIVDGNVAGDRGGAVDAYYSSLTINASTISGNRGGSWAGGIFAFQGNLAIANSVISGNSGGSAGGGGILLVDGTNATVNDSSLIGNVAAASGNLNGGGAVENFNASISISNSTLVANTAQAGAGGAIYNSHLSTTTLVNVTLSNNTAAIGGAIFNVPPGGLPYQPPEGTVSMSNTIIAGSGSAACVQSPSTPWEIIDNGGNIDDGSSCQFGSNSHSNTNPMLGSLGNYGGPTPTKMPRPGSPALDAGVDSVCGAAPVNHLDQRGVARPQGTHCDIGAVERKAVEDTIFLDGFEGY